jgi:hypothetical protein
MTLSSHNMPKWLQGMFAPTLMLWLYALAFGIVSATIPYSGMSWRVEYVLSIAVSLVIVSWVIADAQKRQRRLCYDYDSFVFFAWAIVVPVYLFQTRGARAFLTLLCFAGIWVVAILGATVIVIIREFVSS